MYEISSETGFSAAHHLKNYHGPCENVHGHNWVVKAYVRCTALNELGIGIDFRTVRSALAEAIEGLDHADLNAFFDPLGQNPSSENIAVYIFKKMAPKVTSGTCFMARVEVSETPGNTAAYFVD